MLIPIKQIILENSLNIVKVNNKMQKNYSYELTEPQGKNFDPRFKPELTPKEMLELGIFGGKDFNDVVNTGEYPREWFKNAKLSGINNKPNYNLNYYGVKASLPLREWNIKHWIHPDDPRGWVEWYFRYYMGRRHPDDDRQIRRWIKAQRHIKRLITYEATGNNYSPVVRQGLLHWAYDSRKIPLHPNKGN